MTSPRSFVVPVASDGARLDRFLADALPAVSRSRIQRLVTAGGVAVNDVPAVRGAQRVDAGDRVVVDLPPDAPPAPLTAAPELPLTVLHADADVIVVDKPAGMVVHPAAGHADDTVVNALLARFPDLRAAFDGPRPGIVHRLDRDTSGVMVVARTAAAAESLKAQFKARTVEKRYLVLVKGLLTPAEGVIDAPIGREARERKRMAALPGGRPAQTGFRVLWAGGAYTWLEAQPYTGRTHQIRVHLAAIGHPVTGDTVYGRRDRTVGRMALHAWRLAFDHPTTGARMTFTAPVPADLRAPLAMLGMSEPESGAGVGTATTDAEGAVNAGLGEGRI